MALTAEAIGHFCGMALVEHPGPKGQILLRGDSARSGSPRPATPSPSPISTRSRRRSAPSTSPTWARRRDWEHPGPDNWVEARRAWFVLGSNRRGGMGAEEAVPFSDRGAAERFAAEHGGRVLRMAELPRDWVLGDVGGAAEAATEPPPPQEQGHAAQSERPLRRATTCAAALFASSQPPLAWACLGPAPRQRAQPICRPSSPGRGPVLGGVGTIHLH